MPLLLLSTGNVGTAALAQLGERQTEDLKVPGSIPGGGTLPPAVVPKRLRGWTRNPLGSARAGSSPADCGFCTSVSGLVVEWLPATESARVRFPAHAYVFPH